MVVLPPVGDGGQEARHQEGLQPVRGNEPQREEEGPTPSEVVLGRDGKSPRELPHEVRGDGQEQRQDLGAEGPRPPGEPPHVLRRQVGLWAEPHRGPAHFHLGHGKGVGK